MKRTVDKMKDAAKHTVNTTKANAIRAKARGKAIENATKDKTTNIGKHMHFNILCTSSHHKACIQSFNQSNEC